MKKLKTVLFLISISVVGIASSQTNIISNTGDVGIGTLTPSAKLDVNGPMIVDSLVIIKDSLYVNKMLRVDQDMKINGKSIFNDNGKFKSELKVLGVAKMKDKLVVDGLTRMNGNAKVFGNLKIKSLEDTSLTTSRLLSILPNGKIAISNLTLPQDDTYVCNYTTPWVYADGTITDDDIVLCPNFKSVTIGGNFSAQGLVRLGVTAIGTGPDNQYELNIASVNKTAGIRLLNLGITNAYGIKNVVSNNTITAYSVTTLGNQDVFRVMGDGNVYATKIIVQETPFPDYVFKSDYKLMSLPKLEEFIKSNNHLPKMPTAKEVEANGADLGEINRLLVEKVEELTLYLIDLEKKISVIQTSVEESNK